MSRTYYEVEGTYKRTLSDGKRVDSRKTIKLTLNFEEAKRLATTQWQWQGYDFYKMTISEVEGGGGFADLVLREWEASANGELTLLWGAK